MLGTAYKGRGQDVCRAEGVMNKPDTIFTPLIIIEKAKKNILIVGQRKMKGWKQTTTRTKNREKLFRKKKKILKGSNQSPQVANFFWV